MRWLTIGMLMVASISVLIVYKSFKNTSFQTDKNVVPAKFSVSDRRKSASIRLKNFSNDARAFALKNNFNTRFCFFIDMKIPSGNDRFFIYDLKSDSLLQSGLVTHGSGINNFSGKIYFSNEPGSNCTSLGRYKTGKSYYGKFGLAWKLYGLDKTNSNSFKRFVVLHSHPYVPDHEIAPRQICTSWGCPTVSPVFLNQLKMYLENSPVPILLWIFI